MRNGIARNALTSHFSLLTSCVILALPAPPSFAQEAQITVHADRPGPAVSHYMTGACIEDVNHEIYGGIYSQMIFGESFQEPAPKPGSSPSTEAGQQPDGVSGMWRAVRRGTAQGRFTLRTERPFVGHQSQLIDFTSGEGEFGIENQGLNRWGLSFVEGQPYEGFVKLNVTGQPKIEVLLESRDGSKVYARTQLELRSWPSWQKSRFTLTPNSTDKTGRFTIVLKEPCRAALGYVLLQPGDWGRFKGLPCRKDVVDGLIEQGITVLRYGGSMVNAPEYRWKKMLGPHHSRPPYKGTWYPYSTNGWGIIDFLNLCEAAGFLGIPAFNMDETPEDMADFIDYVNGTGHSDMADLRFGMGHPKPYELKYIELGNEEAVDEHYWERFKPIAEAIWAKDKDITIVVGDFAYGRPITDPYNFEGGAAVKTLAAHKKILDLAVEHDREIWFDVHIGNHEPRECEGLGGVPSFIAALGKLSPKARYKVAIFELNANNHAVRRALGTAHAINELERIADQVPVVCSANCLQPDGQNDNGWNQGLLFLNPWMVWGQPPYYVEQMLARNWLPACVQAKVRSPVDALDVTAKKSADGKTLQLQVVNLDAKPLKTAIVLEGFKPAGPAVKVATLTGQLDDVNTADQPRKIVPQAGEWRPEVKDGQAAYEFPAYSFTILRWE